jgi:hypothetical protein
MTFILPFSGTVNVGTGKFCKEIITNWRIKFNGIMSFVSISVNLKTFCENYCVSVHATFRTNGAWSHQYNFLLWSENSETAMATVVDRRF